MAKAAGIAALLLGVALGPGSYIFNTFYSGRVVFEAPVKFATGDDGPPHARIPFSLSAEDLPATIVVKASASHGPVLLPADPPADRWTLRLERDGRILRQQPMLLQSRMVEATSALVFKQSLTLDANLGGGDFVLEIGQPAEPRLTLDTTGVSVRAAATLANPELLVAGLALLVFGAVLLVST